MTSQDEVVCRDLVELVTDYLDGLLEPATATAVEVHLTLCPACVRYVMQMRQTARLLGHLPVERLSDEAQAAILAAFHDLSPTLKTAGRNARTLRRLDPAGTYNRYDEAPDQLRSVLGAGPS